VGASRRPGGGGSIQRLLLEAVPDGIRAWSPRAGYTTGGGREQIRGAFPVAGARGKPPRLSRVPTSVVSATGEIPAPPARMAEALLKLEGQEEAIHAERSAGITPDDPVIPHAIETLRRVQNVPWQGQTVLAVIEGLERGKVLGTFVVHGVRSSEGIQCHRSSRQPIMAPILGECRGPPAVRRATNARSEKGV